MNFRKHQPDDDIEINLIPLIDVLLVILIFLAATTTFHRYQQLQIDLPHATADAARADALRISIGHNGLYAVDGQVLPGTTAADISQALQLHADALAEPTHAHALIIDADAQAPHAAVVRVMEAARSLGVERIHFTTQAVQ